MSPTSAPAPQEFGARLKSTREQAGVSLEAIAERTKIARSVLEALEAGDFAKLPNRVFIRLFLRQYLGMIGDDPRRWTTSFDGAWDRFERATQPLPVMPEITGSQRRWLPWAVGLLVVVAALIVVVVLDQRQVRPSARAVPEALETPVPPAPAALQPSPTVVIQQEPIGSGQGAADAGEQSAVVATPAATPEPTVAPAVVRATGTPDPQTLVVRAVNRACWVEVRVAGEAPAARLIPQGEEWRVAASGRRVYLILGDAGAAAVEYLEEDRNPAGADGKVLHLTLGPAPGARDPET